MHKLKSVLNLCKKYLFWFLFAGTVALMLVFWWMSTKALATQYQVRKKTVADEFTKVQKIADNKQHPTQKYISEIEDKDTDGNLKDCKLKTLKDGVFDLWQTLYDKQKKNYSWPAVLGEKFVQNVDKNEKIPDDLCEHYWNTIKKYFPELYKIVGVRTVVETADPAGNGGGNAAPDLLRQIIRRGAAPARGAAADNATLVGVVDWDSSDQANLEDHFKWNNRPDSDVIRLRQEDLWVYEALLNVIRETNKGPDGKPAPDYSQANVKRIESIRIGPDAIAAMPASDQPVFKIAGTDAAAAGGARADTRSAPSSRDSAASSAETKEQLLKDRYVNDKGATLEDPAKQPYPECKLMPINMKLHMDQRQISRLLVACADSPMPIEVRRVRIRPGKGEKLEAGMTTSSQSAASSGRDDGRRSRDSTRGGNRMAAVPGSDEDETGSFEVPVEIQGIIYIYNPPDKNMISSATAGEKPADATPPAPGAAETPKP